MPSARLSLERLIYRSLARPQSPTDIDDILRVSVWKNARNGLSGVLGRWGSEYVQVLEGHRPALDRLVNALMADERHSEFTLLERASIPFRRFPAWSMARVDLAGVSGFEGGLPSDTSSLTEALLRLYQRGETLVR